MIDTDKYEGHTPVEIWQVVGQGEPEDNGEYGWHIPYWMACNKAKLGNHKADALLIADAPLFLEAYKRLREVMIYVEQRQPHPALEWALKEGLTLAEIMERIE